MKNDLQNSTVFQLLEINLISAQDLKPPRFVSTRHLKTYALVWIDQKHKLRSRVNTGGLTDPTWNDKFVFMVDSRMLNNWSTAQLVFEFFCVRRFGRNRLIGTSRVLLGSLCRSRYCEGMRGTFRAFHVRRPNGDPQGILNIGLMILDGLPYQVISDQFLGIASAIDYKKLSGAGEKNNCAIVVWRWLVGRFVQQRKMMENMQKKVSSCPDHNASNLQICNDNTTFSLQ